MSLFSTIPLDKYSSLHEISLPRFLGIKSITTPRLTLSFHFNLQTPASKIHKASLQFILRDAGTKPMIGKPDLCINQVLRWRLCLSQYISYDDFLQKIKRTHYRKFQASERAFQKQGASITIIDGNWSSYADKVYTLYQNVANKNGCALYDLSFFHSIAKKNEYKLLCVWLHGSLVGVIVIIDEGSILHSMVCGLDYEHSKKLHAYSLMHYALIRYAFDKKHYKDVDIGASHGTAKAMMDFQPVAACIDIYAKNLMIKSIFRLISFFFTSTLNDQSKLKLNWSLFGRSI